MADQAMSKQMDSESVRISDAFLTARKQCESLSDFPGKLPDDLAAAYQIQKRSISLWPHKISGWKVGGVPPALQNDLSAKRLTGPIFKPTVHLATSGEHVDMPMFKGGFAAIEAEFVLQLGDTSTFPATGVTPEDVIRVVDKAYMGVEIASSPLRTINDIGPLAVVSDFGNNYGLLVGPALDNAWLAKLDQITVSVEIDGETVGTTTCPHGLDGPLGAVAFLIHKLRELGHAIPAGTLVSTGAITGVHDADLGANSVIRFDGVGDLRITLVAERSR